jgi:hypothetical protein
VHLFAFAGEGLDALRVVLDGAGALGGAVSTQRRCSVYSGMVSRKELDLLCDIGSVAGSFGAGLGEILPEDSRHAAMASPSRSSLMRPGPSCGSRYCLHMDLTIVPLENLEIFEWMGLYCPS